MMDLALDLGVIKSSGPIPPLPDPVDPPVETDPILAYFQSTGADGAYYTPWDKSSLFQDAEGTIPVVNSGDPVGLILDVSGNNKHFKQTVSSQRGTWQGDHILLDGVDDHYRTDVGAFALDGRHIQLWCVVSMVARASWILGWPPTPTIHQGPWGTHGMGCSHAGTNRQEYFVSRGSTVASTANVPETSGLGLHRADTLQGIYTINEDPTVTLNRSGTTTYATPLPLILGAEANVGRLLTGSFYGAVVVIDANGATGSDRDNITTEIASRGGLTL